MIKKILKLMESELAYTARQLKIFFVIPACVGLAIWCGVKAPGPYVEYIVIIASLWILVNTLLELNVYRDKLQGRIEPILAFGFSISDLMIGKAVFITVFSVVISFLNITLLRFLSQFIPAQYELIDLRIYFLILPIIFFIAQLSVYLQFKFEISRPLRIIFFVLIIGLHHFRESIIKAFDVPYFPTAITFAFVTACIGMLIFLKKLKNENVL